MKNNIAQQLPQNQRKMQRHRLPSTEDKDTTGKCKNKN